MGTYNSPLYPSTPGISLGRLDQEWDAYLRNVNIQDLVAVAADITTLVSETLTVTTLNDIVFASQYPTVQDAIDALPATGGTVYVAPGTYAGPTTLRDNVRIIATSIAPTSATLNAVNPFWSLVTDQKVIFTYTDDFIMDSLQSVKIDGIVLDFGLTAHGMIIKGCSQCEFPNLTIQNTSHSPTQYALTLQGLGTTNLYQCADLHFGNLYIMGCGSGIMLDGIGPQVVTLCRFDRTYIWFPIGVAGTGINLKQWCDTNSFGWVIISEFGGTGVGVIVNGTATPTVDAQAHNNTFETLIITPDASFTGTAVLQINQSYGTSIRNYSFILGTKRVESQGSPIYTLELATDFNNTLASNDIYCNRLALMGPTPLLEGTQVGFGAETQLTVVNGTGGAIPANAETFLKMCIGNAQFGIPLVKLS